MPRKNRGLPEYCSWAFDRHGKRRVRFRKSGFSTYLHGTPWSDDFMRAYAQAVDGVKVMRGEIGASRTTPGSVNALCVSYYRSPEFRSLKVSTQTMRRGIIERFRNEHGDKRVKTLQRAHVSAIIGAKAATPDAANNLLKVLRLLLAMAVNIDMIAHNPTTGIKGFKTRGSGFHTWSEDEIAAFQARHPAGTKPHLALTLLLYTAQRRGDVIRMGWQHVKNGAIAVRQEKTENPLVIQIHPVLMEELKALPKGNLTFLLTDRGAPFGAQSFTNWFRIQCNAAGLKNCSAHGLRKAAATRLANAGCTTDQIKAITGHKTLTEVARYTKAADQARLARQALEQQLGAEREQNLSNLPTRLDKTEAK